MRPVAGVTGLTSLAMIAATLTMSATAVVVTASPSLAEVGGSPSAEAQALTEAARTGHRVEVSPENTETETVWANPDGTVTSEVAQSAVRVRDDDGGLVPVDLTLHQDTGDRMIPEASSAKVSFSASGQGDLAALDTVGDTAFGLGFGVDLSAPAVAGATATYPITGTDPASVRVATTTNGFSAHVVLPSAPVSAPTYTFPLQLDGLTPSLEGNQLRLANAAGDLVAISAPLQMWDSQVDEAGDPANAVPVDAALVDTADGGTALQLRPSMAYLSDPATRYPVTVDPDVESVTRSSDTQVSKASPSTNYASNYWTRVGNLNSSGTDVFRTYERFDIDAYLGTNIKSATLDMYQYYAGTCANQTTDVFPTKEASVNGITWNNQPTLVTGARWSASVSSNSGNGSGCPAAHKSIDVTAMINGYTTGALDSKFTASSDEEDDPHVATIVLKPSNESTSISDKRFCSMNTPAAPSTHACYEPTQPYTKQPTLSLTYEPDLGDKTQYSTTDHKLNDHSQLKINNDNGNALIKADDLNIHGLGQDLAISRYYNSLSDQTGAFGPKWKLSVGPDVKLRKSEGNGYDYISPSGAGYYGFTRKAESGTDYYKFTTPSGGLGADLVDDNNAEGTYTLTFHQTQLQYVFDKVDPNSDDLYLVRTVDRSGNTITYAYTAGTHQLATVTDASGHTVTITYGTSGNATGKITAITDSNGPTTRTWGYGYGGNGRLTSYTDPDNKTVTYGYDASSDPQITSITDPNNQTGTGPQATITPIAGQVTAVAYASNTAGTTSVGYTFTYEGKDAVVTACKPEDTSSTEVTSTDGSKGKTTYCFKQRSSTGEAMTHRVVDGNGHRASTSYSIDAQPTQFTDGANDGSPDTGSTVATYSGGDFQDRLTKVTDPADSGSTPSSASATYGTGTGVKGHDYLPDSKLDRNGNCTAYTYDVQGRLTDSYLDADTPCAGETDGRHYHQEFNADGTVAYSYDPNGTWSATDDARATVDTYWAPGDTGYVAGTKGMVKTVRKPGGDCGTGSSRKLCTSYTYDGLARIKTMTDGRGKTTTYTYDTLDRVTQVTVDGTTTCTSADLSAGTCISYTYDAEGNLTERRDPQGLTSFGYDRLNRQRSVTTPDGSLVGYDYNDDGKLTQLQTTIPGQPAQTVAYGYDQGNQPKSATINPGTNQRVIDLGSDASNRENYLKFPTTTNVVVNRHFTNAGRPKTTTVQKTGLDPGNLPNWTFDYTKNGHDTSQVQDITVSNATAAINQTVDYGYNTYGLLTSANDPNGPGDYTYTYDGAANLATEQYGTGATTSYAYNRAGQLCWQGTTTGTTLSTSCPATPAGDTTINRDTAGNSLGDATTPLAYNAFNQVSSIGGRTQAYTDQGNDLRVATDTATGSRIGLVNSSIGIIARTTTGGTTYYVRAPGSGAILAEYKLGDDSSYYYYLTNNQGSVTTLINASGDRAAYYRYSPYGDPTIIEDDTHTVAANNPFRYIGGYYDIEGDGYTKLGARYSDNHGHFNQPDPRHGSLTSPLSLLNYGYGADDPMNNTDLSGQSVFDVIGNFLESDSGSDLVGNILFDAGLSILALGLPATPIVAALIFGTATLVAIASYAETS